jgi:hypothetical protein
MRNRDYGSLIINVMRAQLDANSAELAALWHGPEECPLAARPCAVVYDARMPHSGGLYAQLSMRLANGQPAVVMGAFDASLLMDATTWASHRAANFRDEAARRETKATARKSSDKSGQKRGSGPHRA